MCSCLAKHDLPPMDRAKQSASPGIIQASIGLNQIHRGFGQGKDSISKGQFAEALSISLRNLVQIMISSSSGVDLNTIFLHVVLH